jgi:hypothetical protein
VPTPASLRNPRARTAREEAAGFTAPGNGKTFCRSHPPPPERSGDEERSMHREEARPSEERTAPLKVTVYADYL